MHQDPQRCNDDEENDRRNKERDNDIAHRRS
jgi:hypothetical protein